MKKSWRQQGSTQKPYIKEGETIQWTKEIGQEHKQWYIKHYRKQNIKQHDPPPPPNKKSGAPGGYDRNYDTCIQL